MGMERKEEPEDGVKGCEMLSSGQGHTKAVTIPQKPGLPALGLLTVSPWIRLTGPYSGLLK